MSQSIDNMGTLNAGWGICGFTSSLYALYTHNPLRQAKLSSGGNQPRRMLGELKTYLKVLESLGEYTLLNDIEVFTRSFGGVHSDFTVTKYVQRINDTADTHFSFSMFGFSIINTTFEKGEADTKNPLFGIGLPPHVVVDYLKRVCGFANAHEADLAYTANEMILGVYDKKGTMQMYGGLAHYLYYLNNRIYSWGQTFNDVADAMRGKNWDVCCKIALS
jgi:hypothetical protein